MILADIGNTHAVFARRQDGGIPAPQSVPTPSLGRIPGSENETFCVASVVPAVNHFFPQGRTLFITSHITLPYAFAQGVDYETIGADRLANAAALQQRYGCNAVCVDAGSCITFEILDGCGAFAGGAILPGRQLSRFALTQRAAQLYDTPYAADLPDKWGCNTTDAMIFGIDRGLIGAIRELLCCIRHELGNPAEFPVIFTGGDALFFANALHYPFFPMLTLEGMAVIADNLA